jgi:hypothetical protein
MSPKEAKEMPTSTQEWKKDKGPQPVEVPSGNTALIRRKPLTAFWKAGRVPNSLIPMVERHVRPGTNAEPLVWTNEMILDMIDLVDGVAVECVVEPRLYPVPKCPACGGEGKEPLNTDPPSFGTSDCEPCRGTGEGEREEDRLYVDEVDFEDKQFIFYYTTQLVDDVKSFRERTQERMGSVDPVEDVPGEDSEPTPGSEG